MNKKNKKTKKRPNKIMVIENPEKKFHEKWDKNRSLLNIPHPFRMLLIGGVNSGKTLIILNIIPQISPIFEKIILLHRGKHYTMEYDDLETEKIYEIPEANDALMFNPKIKTLLIIEDINTKFLNKEQIRRLNEIFCYTSTHRNLSIIMTSQCYFNIPKEIKLISNFFILWKTDNLLELNLIGRRHGFKKNQLFDLMEKHLINQYDSLWIDKTLQSPYKLRINGFQIIKK
jgi:uridine kinase